ncbi:hypothetical protein AB0L44_00150 [Nonomuraea wenchangensis]|uniref:hypothetical protein n=1 Tax=Nonomuraea wenchangensis TaxID=568860 RepID=UPI003414E4FC
MHTAQGPAWSTSGLDVAAGRYPLSIERHVMRMADLLVPGVTTVTPHARYYSLHALVAIEAERRGLSVPEAQDLLRRCEVVMAAVSYAHDHSETGLPRAHGLDALAGRLQGGEVVMAEAAQPVKGGYVRNVWGFWNPYAASEVSLGILVPASMPTPGPACAAGQVTAGLDGILELAARPSLGVDELRGHPHLCVCAGGGAADGTWLAKLLCLPGEQPAESAGRGRRNTIRLLTRLMRTHEIGDVTDDVRPLIAYGDFLTSDPVTATLETAPVWRGVMLRNYAVSAWRRLWSWLVSEVDGLMPADDLAERFADKMPDGALAAFMDGLPATATPTGAPAPAEEHLRPSGPVDPVGDLAILIVNARRVRELSGRVRDAFLGQRGVELGPEWMAWRLAESRSGSSRDFVRRLTHDLLTRSRRVALSKARRRPDGTLWLPTRLHEREGLLFRTSQEGRGDVGLRLAQLTTVLAGAGVLELAGKTWRVTDAGQVLLD